MNTERIAAALERIAAALEAQNAADPLTMLSMAMGEESAPPAPDLLRGDPQKPLSSNGFTVIYRHPTDPKLEIVARRDESVEGGYSVGVEPA
jgi:hypothetical protein